MSTLYLLVNKLFLTFFPFVSNALAVVDKITYDYESNTLAARSTLNVENAAFRRLHGFYVWRRIKFFKTAVTAGTEVVYNQRAYTPYTEPAI